MARYVAALLGGGANEHGSVLKPETLARMFEPHYQPDPRIPGMGLGFFRDEIGGHRTVGHDGIWKGFRSDMVLAPDEGIGVLAFANTGWFDPRGAPVPVANAVLRHLLDLPDDTVRTDVPEHPEIWSDLCGWYSFGPGVLTDPQPRAMLGAGVEVVVRRGHLTIRGQTPDPCGAQGSSPAPGRRRPVRLPHRPLRVRDGHLLGRVQPRTRRRGDGPAPRRSRRCPSRSGPTSTARVGLAAPARRSNGLWAGGADDAYAPAMEWRRDPSTVAAALEAAEAASPVEAVEAVTRELGDALGAQEISFLIADLSGRALVRLAHVPRRGDPQPGGDGPLGAERRQDAESARVMPFDGGPAEQAIRTQQVQVLPPGAELGGSALTDQWRVLAPVTERGEAIGLLELLLPEEPDDETVREIAQAAHLLAFVVIANRRHTDLYEWGQRTRPLSLSAEIQHRLLAGPQTCEAGAFTLAGWLEPASEIAGDTFDFNLARDALHLSLTDAMGHGVAAALNATLCLGSLRNTRNEGASLLEQVRSANSALAGHAVDSGLEDFVTGLIGRIDLRSGSLELVNAGHIAPYLARDSHVTTVDLPVDLPLGLFADATYRGSVLTLEPGDRLVLVTDGMLERNAAGLDLPAAISGTLTLHPREAVRALADAVLAATAGVLSDDATVLCLDWHGGHGLDRNTVYGADPERASERLP